MNILGDLERYALDKDGETFRGTSVLVTGGSGMVGRYLVALLLKAGARVRVAALDAPERCPPGAEFQKANLLDIDDCLRAVEGVDHVFHLAGVKGSPAMATTRPASFFVPLLLMNTNVMEAARRSAAVKLYLYTSTVGVYAPAELFREEDCWKAMPSPNDRFAAWAKRMGELQAEAYAIEYGWKNVAIVRPANVYGRFDNFDPGTAMVIPTLIHRAVSGEDPMPVWGDGSPVRDFVHALDVARGMIFVMARGIYEPLNLGCGTGISVRELVDAVADASGEILGKKPAIAWDPSKPAGDRVRVLSMEKAAKLGFKPAVPLKDGIRDTMRWYAEHRDSADKGRLNVLRDGYTVR